MSTSVENPPVDGKPEILRKLEIQNDLVNSKFPEKSGFKRKIHHLWGAFYRVNYHANFSEERIDSAFIKVEGMEVIEFREKNQYSVDKPLIAPKVSSAAPKPVEARPKPEPKPEFVFAIDDAGDGEYQLAVAAKSFWERAHSFSDNEIHFKYVDEAISAFNPSMTQDSESCWMLTEEIFAEAGKETKKDRTAYVESLRQHLIKWGFVDVTDKMPKEE